MYDLTMQCGSADLQLTYERPGGASADSAASTPEIGYTTWHFVPDAFATAPGTPVPSPFEPAPVSVAADVATRARSVPVAVGSESLLLPDGRVVSGSGVYAYRVPFVPAASGAPGAANVSQNAAPTLMAAYAGTARSYSHCDAREYCHAEFDAPAGTFVASTTVNGKAMSASARVRPVTAPTQLVTVEVGETSIAPRIRGIGVNGVWQPEVEPGATRVIVTVMANGRPLANSDVTVNAEVLPGSGGHAHIVRALDLRSSPINAIGPDEGLPLYGHFRLPASRETSVSGRTDQNERYSTTFVAGYVGVDVRIVASARIGLKTETGAAGVAIRVPGLVNALGRVRNVYWVGGTGFHPQRTNWYVRPELVPRLQDIADSLVTTIGGRAYYAQYNDMSLEYGGAFTESPRPHDDPARSHQTHNAGFDLDLGFCLTPHQGEDGQRHRVGAGGCSGAQRIDAAVLNEFARRNGGVNKIHFNNHFHIRFK